LTFIYLLIKKKNVFKGYDPLRPRRLLLKKKEIDYLISKIKTKGLTVLPLKIYNKNRLIKVEIAVVRGLKKYEKREKLKEKEFRRVKERILKNF
jgi:SsrA-binding protein